MARRTRDTVVDGVVVGSEYLSLREEVMLDFAAEFRQFMINCFAVPVNTITDIDSFRQNFQPERALNAYLLSLGYTQQQINNVNQVIKDAFKIYARVAAMAILFDHGKLPGGAGPAGWDVREPVP